MNTRVNRIESDSRNQHRLVLTILYHSLVGIVSNREQVRRHLSLPFAFVVINDFLGVDGQPTVGVDSHTEKSGVGL